MDDTQTVNQLEGQQGAAGIVRSTLLGLVEGDILLHLDVHGATPARRLIEVLNWPGSMITLGIDALVRDGLVETRLDELEVIVEPRRPGLVREAVLDAWRD